jgi:site-specific DNA recombinase
VAEGSSDGIPCIIYAARSAPDEQEKSTESQTDEVRERIEAVGGGRWIVDEFAESGKSGYHAERGPELEAAMRVAIESGREHGKAELWVFHSSRLARGDGSKGKRSLNLIHAQLLYENVQVRSVADDEFVTNPMLVGIASTQNNKYSADHGAHVARGRRKALQEGRWPGGPVPDGYLAERSFDERGNKVVTLSLDPERANVIALIYDLSEQGVGDPTVARRLNEAGHRTKAGKPWTRRRVQHTLRNPAYAGRVVKWGEGSRKGGDYERFDEPHVSPGLHPALIDPDRWDSITAARSSRDLCRSRAKATTPAERGKQGGRPTTRYALAKLATCDRCGSRMYAVTSPYKRKSDGKQRRSYVCANVKGCTGLCDQPPIDAEPVDSAVIEYLDRLFVDVDAWAAELAEGSDSRRAGVESELEREGKAAAKLEKQEGKLRGVWTQAIEDGDGQRERIAFDTLAEATEKRQAAQGRILDLNAQLAALDEAPPATDTALDLYNRLAKSVRGGDGSLADLNERLRGEFRTFRLDRVDEGVTGVLPELRAQGVSDIAAAVAEWSADGEPEPTAEEIAHYEHLADAGEPIWIGPSQPVARPLSVIDGKPVNSQL